LRAVSASPPSFGGGLLLMGCLAILVYSAWRAARAKAHQ
jgi:hypothetical protein